MKKNQNTQNYFIFFIFSFRKRMSSDLDKRTESEMMENENKSEEPKISKKKQKKLDRIERRNAFKQERRQQERERKKERRRQQREAGEPVVERKRLKGNTMANSACRLRVAIDCSYDSLMADKDVKDLGGQVARCYSINRRLTNPLQLYVVAANGKDSEATKARLDILNCSGSWDVNMLFDLKETVAAADAPSSPSSAILSGFNKDEVVYLTSESPNILESLDESKVYVIGGLVDHNTHKGLTLRLADQMGIAHAQLPIAQYVKMLYRKVLTVCHVFEILVKYTEYKDWQRAFLDAIPKRHNVEAVDNNLADVTEKASPSEEKTDDCSS